MKKLHSKRHQIQCRKVTWVTRVSLLYTVFWITHLGWPLYFDLILQEKKNIFSLQLGRCFSFSPEVTLTLYSSLAAKSICHIRFFCDPSRDMHWFQSHEKSIIKTYTDRQRVRKRERRTYTRNSSSFPSPLFSLPYSTIDFATASKSCAW